MKLKEITLDSSDKYLVNKYPDSGFFLVTDESFFEDIVIVDQKSGTIITMGGSMSKWLFDGTFKQAEQESPEGKVSESFALKLVSTVMMTPKVNELKD